MIMRRKLSVFQLVIMISSVLVFSSCHGGGGVGGTAAPSITPLTVGAPINDTVVFNSFNFYSAQVVPGSLYKVSITGLTDDADLQVFGNDSSFSMLAQCAVDNTIIPSPNPPFSSEDCVIVAPGNTLFFGVDGSFLTSSSAAVYTIDVELLNTTSVILSKPHQDTISLAEAAVYSVPTTAGTVYTISVTGLDDDADLYVFGNNSAFTSQAVCSPHNGPYAGAAPEDCTLASSGGPFYFIVDGIFSTAASVNFTALTTPAPAVPSPTSEGSVSSPKTVILDTPDIGQVSVDSAPTITSYYAASVTAGQRYTVSITGLSGDVDLNVFNNDSTFSTAPNASCLLGLDYTHLAGPTPTIPEDCTLVASGNTLFFSTTSFTASGGAAFIILVEPGP